MSFNLFFPFLLFRIKFCLICDKCFKNNSLLILAALWLSSLISKLTFQKQSDGRSCDQPDSQSRSLVPDMSINRFARHVDFTYQEGDSVLCFEVRRDVHVTAQP